MNWIVPFLSDAAPNLNGALTTHSPTRNPYMFSSINQLKVYLMLEMRKQSLLLRVLDTLSEFPATLNS